MPADLSPIPASYSVHQLDHARLHNLMPDIQDVADNEDLLEQERAWRFDRDEPPPYASSTGTVIEEHPPWPTDPADAEVAEKMNRPLDDEELFQTLHNFESYHDMYYPGHRYQDEYVMERSRLERVWYNRGRPGIDLFKRAGRHRLAIMIRHCIKKRWEQLGVWNPAWGIPLGLAQTELLGWDYRFHEYPRAPPSDDEAKHDHRWWRWRWQGDKPMTSGTRMYPRKWPDPEHPNARAVQLRKGSKRHEAGPLPPRSNLAPDASAATAEAFIISRPWYTYWLDVEEERTRRDRVRYAKHRIREVELSVVEHWKERGDWDDSFGWRSSTDLRQGRIPGWKWKHESPAPEPVDFDDMDFTPSEVDALEAIRPPTPPPPPPPPSPPRPRGHWEAGKGLFDSIWVLDPSPEPEAAVAEAEPPAEELRPPSPRPPTASQRRTHSAPRGRKNQRAAWRASQGSSEMAPSAMPPPPGQAAGPRRSARIAQMAERREEEHSSDLGPAPAPAPRPSRQGKGNTASKTAPRSRANTARRAGAVTPPPSPPTRARGRPPKQAPPKAGEAPGAVKRRPPPKRASPKGSKPQGVTKRRGRPRKGL